MVWWLSHVLGLSLTYFTLPVPTYSMLTTSLNPQGEQQLIQTLTMTDIYEYPQGVTSNSASIYSASQGSSCHIVSPANHKLSFKYLSHMKYGVWCRYQLMHVMQECVPASRHLPPVLSEIHCYWVMKCSHWPITLATDIALRSPAIPMQVWHLQCGQPQGRLWLKLVLRGIHGSRISKPCGPCQHAFPVEKERLPVAGPLLIVLSKHASEP
jgi:hypothetical protein